MSELVELDAELELCHRCRRHRCCHREGGQFYCLPCSELRLDDKSMYVTYSKKAWWLVRFDKLCHLHVLVKSASYDELIKQRPAQGKVIAHKLKYLPPADF